MYLYLLIMLAILAVIVFTVKKENMSNNDINGIKNEAINGFVNGFIYSVPVAGVYGALTNAVVGGIAAPIAKFTNSRINT